MAETQSGNTRAHSIVINTDAKLNTLTTIDLSGDTNTTSSGVINLTGVTVTGLTLKGANGTSSTNTITGGDGVDSITGGAGADTITGGTGADVISGGTGANRYVYAASADLISTALIDSITGGGGTDTLQVNAAIAVTTSDTFATRMTSVEQLVAETQSGNTRAHSIVINTDAKLNTLTTIDLSGDTNTTSSGVINLTGVTVTGLTLKGANGTSSTNTITGGDGVDSITGGAGADTITGGTGADVISGGTGANRYVYAASADLISTALIDSITGGGGTDTLQVNAAIAVTTSDTFATRMTSVEQLVAETQSGNTRAHSIVINTDAKLNTLTTIRSLRRYQYHLLRRYHLTGVTVTGLTIKGANGTSSTNTITGGDGVDSITGGAGADTITGGTGADVISGGTGANPTFMRPVRISSALR